MAPEGLDEASRIIGKTDIYSFAITVLFLMYPAELAIKLLFLPIEENWKQMNENLSEFPLMLLIINSLFCDLETRADFDPWVILIKKMKTFDETWLKSKINSDILEQNGVDLGPLNKALEKEGGLYFCILDFFGYDIRSNQVNGKEAYKMSTAISQVKNLSLLKSKAEIDMISKGEI